MVRALHLALMAPAIVTKVVMESDAEAEGAEERESAQNFLLRRHGDVVSLARSNFLNFLSKFHIISN